MLILASAVILLLPLQQMEDFDLLGEKTFASEFSFFQSVYSSFLLVSWRKVKEECVLSLHHCAGEVYHVLQ